MKKPKKVMQIEDIENSSDESIREVVEEMKRNEKIVKENKEKNSAK